MKRDQGYTILRCQQGADACDGLMRNTRGTSKYEYWVSRHDFWQGQLDFAEKRERTK